jgi:serine/threonine-protein kinase HipA
VGKPRLAVWFDGQRVADIEARGHGDLRLRHTNSAIDRWPINSPVLSCSLRVGRSWQPATAFLRGLLPEGQHLAAVAAAANLTTSDTYGLLLRYGRDVAGALVITPHDEQPDESRWGAEPYSDESLGVTIGALDDGNEVIHLDSELSIAGLQNKLLLVKTDSGWARPVGGRPSTHILKVDDPRRRGLIEAEYHALLLAVRLELSTSDPSLIEVAGRKCLIVRRFDRRVRSGILDRLHQEDSCQALGVSHELHNGRGKYEEVGGPSFTDIARLLAVDALDPDAELVALARLMTFTVVIGNADGHGKNVALLHDGDGHVRLAPAYDTVPTMLWPQLRTRLAMYVAGGRDIGLVDRESLLREARSWSMSDRAATRSLDDMLGQLSGLEIEHDGLAGLVAANLTRLGGRARGQGSGVTSRGCHRRHRRLRPNSGCGEEPAVSGVRIEGCLAGLIRWHGLE